MASREKVLDFVVKERAEDLVSIVQIDNGTLFYWRYSSPQRLYTKNQDGEEIDAKLPEVTIACDASHGDAIYFSTKIRIFKTVLTPTGRVEVTYVRNFLQGENDTTGGKLNRVRSDGKKYAYGMWDDPETGGIVIDDNDDPTREMRLTSTKRNQAIYLSRNKGGPPTVRRLRKDAVVLEIPAAVSTDDRLNTPFFYFKCGTTLYALNTESMTVLPPLKINNIESIDSFAGVFNGVATLQVQMGNARYVVTAQLPKEYIGKTAPDNIRSVPVKNIPVGVKEASKSTQEIGKNAPVTTPEVTVKNVSTGVREASKSVQEGSRLAVASNRDQKNTGTVSNQLILKEVEKLPEHTTVLQVEDGTLYYLTEKPTNRLYVKYLNKEVDAKLPDELLTSTMFMYYAEAHGNGIFSKDDHFNNYKALFVPPNTIKVQKVGGVNVKDNFPSIKGMRRVRPGFVKDMDHEGVLIDLSAAELKDLKLIGINKGTAVYYKYKEKEVATSPSSLRRVRSNVIIIEHDNSIYRRYGPNDSCPYIYMVDYLRKKLDVVDINAMKFLPALSLTCRTSYPEISGVHNGKITIYQSHDRVVMSAQLPEGYFINQSNSLTANTQATAMFKKSTNTERNDGMSRELDALAKQIDKLKMIAGETSTIRPLHETSAPSTGPCCVICLDKQPNMIFFECMHVIVCEECMTDAAKNPSTAIIKCPNCRAYIKKSAKVYL